MLFDDCLDPYQTNNLVSQPARAAVAHEMEQRLQTALKAVHDDFRPPAYYIERFGYDVAPHGSISYEPGAKMQSPKQIAPGQ